MKKNSLLIILSFLTLIASSQELVKSFYYSDDYVMIPNLLLERDQDMVVPYTIIKETEKKAGILYLNKDHSMKDAILFQGDNNYVINQLIEAENGNLLLAAEGYSYQGQESFYFIELNNNQIVNEFIFNEGGNELDPFAILDNDNNILIGGFVKSRELVNNSFYNMYTETQMIYVGEFSKRGDKIWSKGIEIKGYSNGVCKKMVKTENGVIMLCHAIKGEGKISPLLISLDNNYNISNIVNLSNQEYFTIASDLRIVGDNIELVGTFFSQSEFNIFNIMLSISSFDLISQYEYNMPSQIKINSYSDGKYFGSTLTKDMSFNNLILFFEGDNMSFYEFGSNKTDHTFSIVDNYCYSYSINNSELKKSTFNIFKFDNFNFSSSSLKSNKLKMINNLEYNIIDSFAKSTINTGVDRLEIVNVKDKLK